MSKYLLTILIPLIIHGLTIAQDSHQFRIKADSLFQEGNYYKAEKFYSKIESVYPDDVDLLLIKGKIYFYTGRNDQAKKYFSRVIELSPDYYDAYELLANVYISEGNYTESAALLEKIYSYDDSRADILAKLVNLHYSNNEYAISRRSLDRLRYEGKSYLVPTSLRHRLLPYEVSALYGYEFVDLISDWNELTLSGGYTFDKNLSLQGIYQRYRRFNNFDEMLSLAGYFTFPKRVNWYGKMGFSFQKEFLPHFRLDLYSQIHVYKGFSFLGSWSFLSTALDNVNIISLGGEQYIIPKISVSYQFFGATSSASGNSANSHLFRANLFEDDYRLTIGFVAGSEFYDNGDALLSFGVKSNSLYALLQYYLNENWALAISTGFSSRSESYSTNKMGVGFVYKF